MLGPEAELSQAHWPAGKASGDELHTARSDCADFVTQARLNTRLKDLCTSTRLRSVPGLMHQGMAAQVGFTWHTVPARMI